MGVVTTDDPLAEFLPEDRLERATALQNAFIGRATGEGDPWPPGSYEALRKEFMADPTTKALLPRYARTCRDLGAFWPLAKAMSSTWEGRRVQIREDFEPLLDHIESGGGAPLDEETASVLGAFSSEGVASIWTKALERRDKDSEGAITTARTLLETVSKHILDEAGDVYSDKDDLPRLYRLAAARLNLAPSAHTEEIFRQILSGCTSVVGGLGAVRNKISDSHGKGSKGPRAAPRHAQLAVNLAGAMATFMVETWLARKAADEG